MLSMKKRLIICNISFTTFILIITFILITIFCSDIITVKNLLPPFFITLILSIILCIYASYRLTKSFTNTINNINPLLPDNSPIYKEFTPLIEALIERNEQINSRVNELKIEHDRQDTMRREFTANVSHELKTPLTSISGYAEIIRDGLVKKDKISDFASKIHDEAARLITLVGDIIKLSQLDEKDISVKIEDIDLYETANAVIKHLKSTAEEKNVTIKLSGDHSIINGAEQIIEEMIFNLCDNAIKYNVNNGKIYVNIKQCVDGVELSVKDTGIGISKEDVEHIFERFFRADKSHSKEIGGTGLGLSIVKHGAIFHGATLDVRSKLGKGTTIKICF